MSNKGKKRRLSNYLKGCIEYSSEGESPLSFHTWVAISTISGLLQRRCFMKIGLSTVYPGQYICLVGPSGRTRKGEAMQIGRQFLTAAEIPLIGEDNTPESIIRDMRESHTYYTDETGEKIRQCAVTVHTEELAVFMGYRDPRMNAYLTQWGDARSSWKRGTKGKGKDALQNVAVNIQCATAPDWIPHMFTRESIGGGLTSRFIFIYEDRKRQLLFTPPAEKVSLRKDIEHDSLMIKEICGEYKFNEEAQAYYNAWYKKQEEDLVAGRPCISDPIFMGYISRRQTHIARICMVLAASMGDSLVITLAILRQAIALLEHAERNMPNVFRGTGRSKYAETIDQVISLVSSRGECPRSEILTALYRDITAEDLEQITKTLVFMGILEVRNSGHMNDPIYIFKGMDRGQ